MRIKAVVVVVGFLRSLSALCVSSNTRTGNRFAFSSSDAKDSLPRTLNTLHSDATLPAKFDGRLKTWGLRFAASCFAFSLASSTTESAQFTRNLVLGGLSGTLLFLARPVTPAHTLIPYRCGRKDSVCTP